MAEIDDEKPGTAPAAVGDQAAAVPSTVDDDWDDDWDDEDERRPGGRRDLTLILAIAVAVLVIALVVVLTRPKDKTDTVATPTVPGQTTGGKDQAPPNRNWQGPVAESGGAVEARVGKETGVFIWTDYKGWHLRNTTAQPVEVVVEAATVVTTVNGKKSGDPKASATVMVPKGDFKTGVDVDLGFSEKATFTVSSGGNPVPAADVKLGGSGQATENPVSFTKA